MSMLDRKKSYEDREKKRRFKKRLLLTSVVLLALTLIGGCNVWYWNTESGQRVVKDWKSNNVGGLNRTVEVYTQDGELLKSYTGKIDVQNNDYGNKVLFDLDGKRYVFYNAVVVVEEK